MVCNQKPVIPLRKAKMPDQHAITSFLASEAIYNHQDASPALKYLFLHLNLLRLYSFWNRLQPHLQRAKSISDGSSSRTKCYYFLRAAIQSHPFHYFCENEGVISVIIYRKKKRLTIGDELLVCLIFKLQE